MIKTLLTRLIDGCTRAPLLVIGLFLILGGAGPVYSGTALAISTDTRRRLPADLRWRQRQIAYDRLFSRESVLVVLEAPTPEGSAGATATLAGALQSPSRGGAIRHVSVLGRGPFFDRSALLLMPPDRAGGQRRGAGSLIPPDQDARLALGARLRAALSASFSASSSDGGKPEPTDAETVGALREAAARLTALVPPREADLGQLRTMLQAKRVAVETLPPALKA